MINSYYYKGKTEETEDILDFANMVFSMSYRSIDFARLIPKAYSKKRCHIPIHHMIKENEKIKALADVYPVTLKQLSKNNTDMDVEIKAAYIGTVCVHPNSRGKGYMKTLMQKVQEDAISEGFDIMFVDGNRHRYQNYGFEKAGIKYEYCVRYKNIKHMYNRLYGEYIEPVYSFEPVEDDSPYIDKMYKLYSKKNVMARTKEEFFLNLKGNRAYTYAVLEGESFAGYINISEDESGIHEIELENVSEIPGIIYDLFEELALDEVMITAGVDEIEKTEWLDKICDFCSMQMSHQIKILNYEKVLSFLLSWKQKYCALSDGKYVIGIEAESYNIYSMEIKEGNISVMETSTENPDIILEEMDFVKLFTTGMFFQECNKNDSSVKNAPQGWFPLPFFLPEADAF